MATPFRDISKLMFMEMKESTISNMNTSLALDLLSDLIITSATVDFNKCKKDLNLYKEYVDNIVNINIDKDTKIVKINRVNSLLNEVVVSVNDVEIDDVSYEFTENEITITYDFKKDDEVEIVNYFEGEFEVDLNHREKYIIALGAYTHYINQQVNAEENLKTYIGDKDYSRTSNWQTLNALISLKTTLDLKLNSYIYEYKNDLITVEDLI